MFVENVPIHYPEIPVPAVHMAALGAASPPWVTNFSKAFVATANGTGSNYSLAAYLNRHGGYELFPIERTTPVSLDLSQRYVELIQKIQSGFGRTLSRLPAVFGVSRQTLYNWRSGEIPKPHHEAKLVQLAAAAQVFSQVGFKPTPAMLDRTVGEGKSFLTLLAEGADGATTAQKLVRIVQRGLEARARLDKALAGKSPAPLHSSDFGAPALDEDA
jgi:hypothetical protein